MNIQDKIKELPSVPGVYRFYDKSGTIIYIGKAIDLKKRVSSYFAATGVVGKTLVLVKQIADLDFIMVETETDAFLLENNLIKKYAPKYNILLKDDKSYPWICIKKEPFPRVFYTRKLIKDGSKYFGPFTSITLVRTMLLMINQVFKLRNCKYDLAAKKIAEGKYKVCLQYHLKKCNAPCIGEQSTDEYDMAIQQIENILKGKTRAVIQYFEKEMNEFAENMEFEQALDIKNRIKLLEQYQSKSMVVSPTFTDTDVFTILSDEKIAFVNYLKIASGAIIQAQTVEVVKKLEEPENEILELVVFDLRTKFKSTAKTILSNIEFTAEGCKVKVPSKGDDLKLLEISLKNLTYARLERLKQAENLNPNKHSDRILAKLQADLHLKDLPMHIECFDNSNLQGTNPVAACVVFKNAKPSSADYRHFKVKTVEGPDDFASMIEIITRRYSRLVAEAQPLPQLIVVDGGKGQLSAAVSALKNMNLYGTIPIIGLAKRLEEVYFPEDSVPLYISKTSESLKLLQQLRDEAHRFGITFHRNLRSKNFTASELKSIDSIGEKTVTKLLTEFKSVKKVAMASFEELEKVVGRSKAEILTDYFKAKTDTN